MDFPYLGSVSMRATKRWVIRVALGIALAAHVGGRAWANTFAFAVGDGDGEGRIAMGWGDAASQSSANAIALKKCNETSPPANCKLWHAKGIARASGKGRLGISVSSVSLDVARRTAIKDCDSPTCKITFETNDPGFFSIAMPADSGDGISDYYIFWASYDPIRAANEALALCEKAGNSKCSVFRTGLIPGEREAKNTSESLPPKEASQKNCRPNTSQIQFTSQCTNGNCVITYENGCKMNVQVQARFDPFTNQWKYPAPSC